MNNAIPEIIGWHFAADKLRDGTPLPEVGQELPPIDNPKPCVRGYHLSVRAIDAIGYAPGLMVARVRGGSPHVQTFDKYACQQRVVIAGYADAHEIAYVLAAKWAHRAISIHAAAELRAVGLTDQADALATIKPWDWRDRAAAIAAANATSCALVVKPSLFAVRFARAAVNAVSFIPTVTNAVLSVSHAEAYAANAAGDSARIIGGDATGAFDAERDLQNTELEAALRELLGVAQ